MDKEETAPKRLSGLTIGLAQIAPALGDLKANLNQHLELLARARDSGADLLIFPELSLTGYFLRDLVPEVAVQLPLKGGYGESEELRQLQNATKEIDAMIGCVIEDRDHLFFNASLYLSRGRIVNIHRKVYLPTYGIFDEARFFARGDCFRTFEVKGQHLFQEPLRAGTLICEDLWHPSSVGSLARQGLDMLFIQSASPGRGVASNDGRLGTERSYAHMLSVYAQLYTTYIVFVNRVGAEEGMLFWGGSRVIGPDGDSLAPPASDSPSLSIFKIDPFALRKERIQNPLLRDERYDIQDADANYARTHPL